MIGRDGATCRNNYNFEHPTVLNAPLEAHSIVKPGEHKRTDRQTHRCYQMYYLPCFAVDNDGYRHILVTKDMMVGFVTPQGAVTTDPHDCPCSIIPLNTKILEQFLLICSHDRFQSNWLCIHT